MKKYKLLVGLFFSLILVSCGSEGNLDLSKNSLQAEDGILALRNTYTDLQKTFQQLRGNPQKTELLSALDKRIVDSRANAIIYTSNHSQIFKSAKAYYCDVDTITQEDISSYSENPEEFIDFTEKNSTPDYINFMKSIIRENKLSFSVDDIINNTSLMYNEKISLLAVCAYKESLNSSILKVNTLASRCVNGYQTDIYRCNRNTVVGLAFGALAAVGSGGLTAAITVSYVWAQDMMCRSDASDNYTTCKKDEIKIVVTPDKVIN